jgi:hypothetical protein
MCHFRHVLRDNVELLLQEKQALNRIVYDVNDATIAQLAPAQYAALLFGFQ